MDAIQDKTAGSTADHFRTLAYPGRPAGNPLTDYATLGKCFAAFVLTVCCLRAILPAFHDDDHFLVIGTGGSMRIQDFASHLMFAKTFWTGSGDYSPEGHLRMMEAWSGQPIQHALPFGYAPTMLLSLAPVAAFPVSIAFALWTLLAASVCWWMCLLGIRMTRTSQPSDRLRSRGESSIPWRAVLWPLVLIAICFGPIGFACLAHGQTALLTTGALLFLALHAERSERESRNQEILLAVVLWLLTSKPPLAITGGFALLALKRFRVIGIAIALTLVSTLCLGAFFPNGWIADYLTLSRNYHLDGIDAAYAWSIHPESMANLRGILHSTCGVPDGLATRMSSLIWLTSLVGLVGWVWKSKRATSVQIWSLCVAAYLLLCHHVSFTELTHLAVPLLLIGRATRSRMEGTSWGCAGLIAAVVLLPNDFPQRPLIAFGLMISLTIVIAGLYGKTRHLRLHPRCA